MTDVPAPTPQPDQPCSTHNARAATSRLLTLQSLFSRSVLIRPHPHRCHVCVMTRRVPPSRDVLRPHPSSHPMTAHTKDGGAPSSLSQHATQSKTRSHAPVSRRSADADYMLTHHAHTNPHLQRCLAHAPELSSERSLLVKLPRPPCPTPRKVLEQSFDQDQKPKTPHCRLAGTAVSSFLGYGNLSPAMSSTNSALVFVSRGLLARCAPIVEKERPL